MSFDAFGSVQGNPVSQPVMEGGKIPESPASQPISEPSQDPAPAAPEAKPATQPQSPEAPKPAGTPKVEGVQDPKAAPVDPAPYTPNFKFKVSDKEHEINKLFHGIIKDAETEKLVRELHQKAYGLDLVKPKYNDLRERYKQVELTAKGYETSVNELRDSYRRGDFDTFFKQLNIPQEKVLQWVLDKAHYNELPPEQRQVLDAKKQAEQRAWSLEKEHASLQAKFEDTMVQARARELQVTLERDDVKKFAESFDSRFGAGKFLDEVINRGELAWYTSKGKVELTPEQAVQEVMKIFAGLAEPKPSAPPVLPVPGAQPVVAPQAAAPAQTPTLPNISGRQTTAVSKSKPKSIDDLKALWKQKAGLA